MCLKRVASLACRSGGSPHRLLEPSPHVRPRAALVVLDRGGAAAEVVIEGLHGDSLRVGYLGIPVQAGTSGGPVRTPKGS